MIDIKDLSVGDCLIYRYTGAICRVITIYGNTNTIVIENNKGMAYCKGEDVEPIPLSPELLGRFGFRLNPDFGVYEYHCRKFRVTIDLREHQNRIQVESLSPSWKGAVPFHPYTEQEEGRFFHELQHLLRLAKVNWDIKL